MSQKRATLGRPEEGKNLHTAAIRQIRKCIEREASFGKRGDPRLVARERRRLIDEQRGGKKTSIKEGVD